MVFIAGLQCHIKSSHFLAVLRQDQAEIFEGQEDGIGKQPVDNAGEMPGSSLAMFK